MAAPLFLLFFRPHGGSDVERLVDDARAATLRDTAARAQQAGFDRIIIATSTPQRFESLPGVEIDSDPTAGHQPTSDSAGPAAPGFAPRLRDLLTRHRPTAVCYAGAGMPLIDRHTWADLLHRLNHADAPLAITNNVYSSDLLATNAPNLLTHLPSATPDNGLALYLRDHAGLPIDLLPRSAATLLDIDTPTDLQILTLLDRATGQTSTLGPELRDYLHRVALNTTRLEAALDHFTQRETEVLVVGRVGAAVWQALERDTASRIRVISEERGMRASQRPRPRSILGFHLGATDPTTLVDALSELGDAVFMDTRPLYAHLGWNAGRADRFHADLHHGRDIHHPDLRTFANAVAAARIPFVLGGHSLVSGGLLAAIDTAWARWESHP